MRILFTVGPLVGHLQPMLPLLRAASAAGHQVVVATGPDLVGELQRRGLFMRRGSRSKVSTRWRGR